MQLFAPFFCNRECKKWVALFLRVDWLAEAAWWCHRALRICNKTPFSLTFIRLKKLSRKTLGRWIVYSETDDGVGAQLKQTERRQESTGSALLRLLFPPFFVHVWKHAQKKCKFVRQIFFTMTFDTPGGPCHLPASCPSGGRGIRPWLNVKDTGPLQQSPWEQIYEAAKRWPGEKYRQLNHTSPP